MKRKNPDDNAYRAWVADPLDQTALRSFLISAARERTMIRPEQFSGLWDMMVADDKVYEFVFRNIFDFDQDRDIKQKDEDFKRVLRSFRSYFPNDLYLVEMSRFPWFQRFIFGLCYVGFSYCRMDVEVASYLRHCGFIGTAAWNCIYEMVQRNFGSHIYEQSRYHPESFPCILAYLVYRFMISGGSTSEFHTIGLFNDTQDPWTHPFLMKIIRSKNRLDRDFAIRSLENKGNYALGNFDEIFNLAVNESEDELVRVYSLNFVRKLTEQYCVLFNNDMIDSLFEIISRRNEFYESRIGQSAIRIFQAIGRLGKCQGFYLGSERLGFLVDEYVNQYDISNSMIFIYAIASFGEYALPYLSALKARFLSDNFYDAEERELYNLIRNLERIGQQNNFRVDLADEEE